MPIHRCIQKEAIEKLILENEKKTISIVEYKMDIDQIKKAQERLFTKMDDFIKTAHETYATKEELKEVKINFKEDKEYTKENIKEAQKKTAVLESKYLDLAIKVATIGTLVMIYFKWQ